MLPLPIIDIGKIVAYLLPMYVANSSAMVFGFGKVPIDFNLKFLDGKPIFGRGKTWKGAIAGIICGTITAILVNYLMPVHTIKLTENYVLFGFLLAFGAILGDLISSFFKRRSSLKQGESVLFLDQLNFVVGAIALSGFMYLPDFYEFLLICVVTMLVHRGTNFIAYKLKMKKVPW